MLLSLWMVTLDELNKINLSQKEGHKAGVKAARNAIEFAVKNDIKYLTLYAFSTENWKRSKKKLNR